MDIQMGALYMHYKGSLYHTIIIAKLESNGEEMIVYRSAQTPEEVWVRPLSEFTEEIYREGKMIPRFILVNAVDE